MGFKRLKKSYRGRKKGDVFKSGKEDLTLKEFLKTQRKPTQDKKHNLHFKKAIDLLNLIAWIETHPQGYIEAKCSKCGSKEVVQARYFQLECEHCGQTKTIVRVSTKYVEPSWNF